MSEIKKILNYSILTECPQHNCKIVNKMHKRENSPNNIRMDVELESKSCCANEKLTSTARSALCQHLLYLCNVSLFFCCCYFSFLKCYFH